MEGVTTQDLLILIGEQTVALRVQKDDLRVRDEKIERLEQQLDSLLQTTEERRGEDADVRD